MNGDTARKVLVEIARTVVVPVVVSVSSAVVIEAFNARRYRRDLEDRRRDEEREREGRGRAETEQAPLSKGSPSVWKANRCRRDRVGHGDSRVNEEQGSGTSVPGGGGRVSKGRRHEPV